MLADTILLVQHHEYAAHAAKYPYITVRALPHQIDNLGPTRDYIAKNWMLYSDDGKIILLDDDLEFYLRADPKDWRLTTPTPAQLTRMFDEIEHALDTYLHVGVSGREGNNRIPEYGVESTRYMRLLAYNYGLWPDGIEPGRINGMSDFDTNLQLLRAGFPSYVFYRYAQGQKGTQTAGGCSLNRTHDTHNGEIENMLIWHKGFCKDRLKENKTGGDFGTRRELTMYWKKAYEDGVKNKAWAEVIAAIPE
jgi:hypothetical protein